MICLFKSLLSYYSSPPSLSFLIPFAIDLWMNPAHSPNSVSHSLDFADYNPVPWVDISLSLLFSVNWYLGQELDGIQV